MRQLPEVSRQCFALPDLGTVAVNVLRLSQLEVVREASKDKPPITFILELLSIAVVDLDDNEPVLSADDWDRYAGMHRDQSREVIEAVMQANGLQAEAVAKN